MVSVTMVSMETMYGEGLRMAIWFPMKTKSALIDGDQR